MAIDGVEVDGVLWEALDCGMRVQVGPSGGPYAGLPGVLVRLVTPPTESPRAAPEPTAVLACACRPRSASAPPMCTSTTPPWPMSRVRCGRQHCVSSPPAARRRRRRGAHQRLGAPTLHTCTSPLLVSSVPWLVNSSPAATSWELVGGAGQELLQDLSQKGPSVHANGGGGGGGGGTGPVDWAPTLGRCVRDGSHLHAGNLCVLALQSRSAVLCVVRLVEQAAEMRGACAVSTSVCRLSSSLRAPPWPSQLHFLS